MKKGLFIIAVLVIFAGLSGGARSPTPSGIKNPAVRSPIGRVTFPQSGIRSGLLPSPNPININGNLLISGNVAGGKHFRGIVPYNATSAFAGTESTTTLDSFLRRSAGPGISNVLPGRYTPYFSQTGTVTTTQAGQPNIIRPPTTSADGRAAAGAAVPAGPQQRALVSPETGISRIGFRPPRLTPQQLEKLILDGVLTGAEAKRVVDEQNVGQMERLQRDIQQLQHRAPQTRQSLIVRDESLRPFSKLVKDGDVLQPFKLQKPSEQAPILDKRLVPTTDGLTDLRRQGQFDVYERMKQQIDRTQKVLKQLDTTEQIKGADVEKEPDEEKTVFEYPDGQRRALTTEEPERAVTGGTKQDELTGIDVIAKAKSIMGPHKSFASYEDDKFNHYMRVAEEYVKKGKYYRAADTYTLASIFKPDDPLAYAGKSHALFAAGGYMSSALFLARALEIFPEYAQFKIDLVTMVGDRDKLESRVADIKLWLEKSGSPDLQFLLAYVYYHMGRIIGAKEAIDAAYEKLPDSPAVIALKKAIDAAAGESQPPIK